jgi:hypothetical protein
MSDWGSVQARAPWAGVPLDAVRLPALRHLNMSTYSMEWAQHGAAHMRGAARLVAAYAASLRTLRLRFKLGAKLESHHELAALESGFLESVLLAAPLAALQRLDLSVDYRMQDAAIDKARYLEALRLLGRLSLPRLTRLSLWGGAATGQGVRWLEGAHLPALRRLAVIDHVSGPTPEHSLVTALSAPRWSALEALDLDNPYAGGMAALSAALAPTLRHLAVYEWLFGTESCVAE